MPCTGDRRSRLRSAGTTSPYRRPSRRPSRSSVRSKRVWFILQLGYFKAKHVFVPCELAEIHEDLTSILAAYFPTTPLEDRRPLNKRTRLEQHHLILALCNYRHCDAPARQHLAAKARHAATVSAKPVYIFRELLHHLDEHRIVAPSYSFLQELVSKALTAEQHRVTTIVRRALTVADTEAFRASPGGGAAPPSRSSSVNPKISVPVP